MSSDLHTPPQALLEEVTHRLNHIEEAELEAVNRFLKKLEMLRLRRSLGEAADRAGEEGLWETVDQSVQEFRQKQPY